MATKKTVRPKIKDKLPEKLPPVEPDVKEEQEEILAGEMADLIKEEGQQEGPKTEAEIGKHYEEAAVDDIAGKKEEGPTPEEVIEAVVKTLDERTATKDDSAKEAQPDKYPSHSPHQIPVGQDQPFLFGEADQILNALETELSEWKDRKQKNLMSRMAINDKIDFADDRIEILSSAILATKKHAPMTEDPAVPEQIGETAVKVVEGLRPDTVRADELTDPGTPELTAKEDTTSSVEPPEKTPALSGELAMTFRTQSQPLPEVLFLGDIITTSWNTGPYRVEGISGPYDEVDNLQHGGMIQTPDHWSIKCSEPGAKRNKDGRLAKNYQYSYINMVVAVGNRFLSVHSESADEIFLVGKEFDKKRDISDQEPNPNPVKAEEDLDL